MPEVLMPRLSDTMEEGVLSQWLKHEGDQVRQGRRAGQPVVRDDQVAIATTMTLTLSIDHRAVDGATSAGFLTHLKELIEEPLDIVL